MKKQTAKFRAIGLDKVWRYGAIVEYPDGSFAIYGQIDGLDMVGQWQVKPETIGQMLPHPDATGKEIYTGDCYRTLERDHEGEEEHEVVWIFVWVPEFSMFATMPMSDYVMYADGQDPIECFHGEYPYPVTADDCKRITICQNIHEKPALLKQ